MNKKFLALALSGALTLSLLAACGSPDAAGSTPPVSTPPVTESLTPSTTPTPEVTPSETPGAQRERPAQRDPGAL